MQKTFSNIISNIKDKSHIGIFKTVKELFEEGHPLDDKTIFDVNILTKLYEAYYEQYDLREIDEDRDVIIKVKQSEVLLPLNDRPSKILEELNWLLENGYDLNSHIPFDTYNDDIDDFLNFPVTCLFSIPNDLYMAEWLLENGCDCQLKVDIGDGETLADWCFDNLDICSEDYLITDCDIDILCKITAEMVRLLIKHGCKRRSGIWMSVDENNKVNFHSPDKLF